MTARALEICGKKGQLPDDAAVFEYCDKLIQGFLEDGCIDGESADLDALYEALQPFLDPEEQIGRACFVAAIEQIGREQRAQDGFTDNGCQPSCKPAAEAHRTPDAKASEVEKKNGKLLVGRSAQTMGAVAGSVLQEAVVQSLVCKAHARLHDLVVDLMQSATPGISPDPTIVEYVSNIMRDGLEENEQATDLLDAIVGVAPELEAFFSPPGSFHHFIAHASQVHICELGSTAQRLDMQQVKDRAKQAHAPAQTTDHASSAASSSSICFTLRTNLPEDDEGGENEEQASLEERQRQEEEEQEVLRSPRRAQLREIFPSRPLNDLATALSMAGGNVEEAIEKLFAMEELDAVSLSYAHTVSAQQKADLEAFRAATRERALTMYNHVKTVEAGEKGKGTVVRPLLSKDEAIDKAMTLLRAGGRKKEEVRYLNNEVVARKGERTIYVKTKNAVEDADPRTFIGLKVKKKGSGGPSPNFK